VSFCRSNTRRCERHDKSPEVPAKDAQEKEGSGGNPPTSSRRGNFVATRPRNASTTRTAFARPASNRFPCSSQAG